MSIIYSYPEQGVLNPNDMLIGTSAEVVGGKQKNITRNFSIQQIADYINDGGTVFNPAATDFQIAVFNQGGTKLTGSIISQNTFPNGTFVTIAGDLIANAATLNGAVAINGFLTLNGGATLGSGAAGELIAFASTTRLNAPIQDQLGRVGALDQILISDTAGRVSWQNYTSGLTYTGTWDALNNVTAPQGTPIVSSSGTNGEFYIVTLAGNTPLNGQPPAPTTPAYWQVGDWVVFVEDGGVGVWQKIDNSSAITGTGTDNKITMWTGGVTPSTSLTDSIMSQNTGNATITVTGALTTTGNVNAGGSVIATANVSGVDVTASGNVSAVNVTATGTVTPTTITDEDAGVGTAGQILSSTVTGVEWIDNKVGTVTGTGTTNTLPIWTNGGPGELGDSIVDEVAAGGVFTDIHLNIKGQGGLNTENLQLNKSLWDGGAGATIARSAGTDGQMLTSSTQGVAPDQYQEVKWVTPTVGTVTNFTTVSTAIPGITTAVTDSTTTPELTLSITGTPTASLFLDGTGNWSSPGGGVTDITATAPLDADVATGSVTLSMPAYVTATGGYVPSGGTAGQYLDGATGSWTTLPAGDTYDLGSGASTIANSVEVELTSGSATNNSAITLTGAGGLTVTQSNDVVTLTAPAGSDTTYFLTAGAKNQNKVPLNLTSSVAIGSTVVNLTEGTGITLTRNASNQVTIASTAAIGNFLPLSGGTMTGVISMGSDKITNVNDPTDAQDAATKQYVDDSVVGGLIYQGGYNASTNSPRLDNSLQGNGIAVSKGWTYTVTADGTFYTETVKIGDVLIAEQDIAAGTGALTDWTTVQSNIDVASATVQGIANFPTGNNQLNIATGSVTAKTFGDGTSATSITGGYVPSASSAATGTFLSKTGSWVIPPNTGGTVTSVGLSSDVAAFTVSPTPVTGSGVLTLNRNGGTAGQYIDGATGAWTTLPAPGTGTVTGTGAATQVAFWDAASNINGDTAFNWDNTNKRLGIGTDSPDEKLDVENGNIRLKSNSDGSTGLFRIYDAAGIEAGQIYPHSGDLRIFSNNDIVFNQTGNVGIGTTTPNGQLTLGGNAAGSTEGLRINDPSNVAYGAHFSFSDTPNEVWIGGVTNNTYNSAIGIHREATRAITIDVNSNVGIGTAIPGAKLDILGKALTLGGDNGAWTTRTNAETKSGFITFPHYLATEQDVAAMIFSSSGSNGNPANNGIDIGGGTSSYNSATQLRFFTSANPTTVSGTPRLTIDSAGDVGIGTTSPSSYDADSDNLVVFDTANAGITIATSDLTGKSSIRFSDGTTGSRPYVGGIEYLHSDNSMRFDTAALERMRITSGGGISFGSSGTAYGTSGQVLTSNGNASPTWQAAASGLPTKTVANLTGNGSNGVMALNASPSSTAYVDMYIDGVYQNKNTFGVSGSTLTLNNSVPFPNGASVETVTTT